jgi:hypothetical protein
MPYITREDGERFIIPSYRDILSVKKASLLKKELKLLGTSYGGYVALQKKNSLQYEVAFSPDPGYLLGECVWHYFKRPFDMVYCEAIPNTTEAILVIVKSGSVYLDGSFPVDSIPEELVIFQTQQNNFSIYLHGNVPISEIPEEGKFTFDTSSVKSFTVLDEPVFPTLPGVKAFQLQLIDTVLKNYGIGVLPIKPIVITVGVLGFLYLAYFFITMHKKELPQQFAFIQNTSNPYQGYMDQLTSPDPTQELRNVVLGFWHLFSLPGWHPVSAEYTSGTPGRLRVQVVSEGAKTEVLLAWAQKANVSVDIESGGIYLNLLIPTSQRPSPTTINRMQLILSSLIDRVSYILPGNNLKIGPTVDKGQYKELGISITLSEVSLLTLDYIGKYIKDMPLVLTKFTMSVNNNAISGSIFLKALGN